MTDKLTQTGSQASQELSRSLCQEQIIIDGVDVSNCGFIHPEISKTQCHIALAFSDQYEECTNCEQIEDCYFKQLARKTQECEKIKEKYEALKLENQEGYEIVAELKQECEELKKELNGSEKWRVKSESLNEKLDIENTRYRKALEEIEEVLKVDFQLPCASTVCSYPNTCKDSLTNHGTKCMRFCLLNIKSIINKAKGEE